MSNSFIVKVEIVKKARLKQEFVRMHTRDFSIDIERPLDETIQAALGPHFKGYFKAQQHGDRLVLQNETTWTEWNKGRLGPAH